MAQINFSDYIFAQASVMGKMFFDFAGQGISSFAELVKMVRSQKNAPRGMITVTVRNSSQGWTSSRAIYSV